MSQKNSWEVRRILAEKATSMKFIRVLSYILLLKKNFSVTTLTHYNLLWKKDFCFYSRILATA